MYFWTWDTEEVLDHDPVDARSSTQSGRGACSSPGSTCRRLRSLPSIVRTFVARYEPASLPSVTEATTAATRASLPAAARHSAWRPVRSRSRRPPGGRCGTAASSRRTGSRADMRVCGGEWTALRRSGVRQHADPRRDRNDRLDAIRDRVSRRCRRQEHQLRALMPGDGTAWFDDLTIELDGEPYTTTERFDLGFESASPRGFFTGAAGLSRAARHERHAHGKQSLRMQHVAQARRPQRRLR